MTADLSADLTAEELGRVHLVGIGGVGMSGLARLLLVRGIPVSGSELREWPHLATLRALGGTIFMSHQPANLDDVDTVVYSTAIPADHVELVEARKDERLVAGAFNVASRDRLFGRYWGAFEEYPFLHFNVCLYHSVRDCIARGLRAFEGGAGGEHKLSRGFLPAETYSAHAFSDPRLERPMREALRAEFDERREALSRWLAQSPILKPQPEAR